MARQSSASKPASKQSCCDGEGHSGTEGSTVQKVAIGLLVFVLLGVLFTSWPPGGSKTAPIVIPNKTSTVVELAGGDVLGLMRRDVLNSSFVSVKGVRLGDSAETVINSRGKPAFSESPDTGILNLRYENDANSTDMIVHLEGDIVTRIAVKEGMAPVLVNDSRMEYYKEDVTRALGKPDKVYDTKFYHIFEYHALGLEVYFKARRMAGFGFVPPK